MTKLNISKLKNTLLTDKSQYFFWLFVMIQTLFIIYLNLFESHTMIDYDGAKLYQHAVEMWNQKTPFISGWKYITTMELDCSLFFAVFFYGLTDNIFLSFGLSNILMVFAYISVIYKIVSRTEYKKYAALAVALCLIPYEAGMLAYFNMLFFNGAQYGIKVLLPLLFLLILSTPGDRRRSKGNIAWIGLYFFLLFLTSMSSGIYVMMCGIAPLIVIFLLDLFQDGGFKKYGRYHISLSALSIVTFLLGSGMLRLLGITARGNALMLTKAENMQLNFNADMLGLFQVLNAVASGDIPVLSLSGIIFLMKALLTGALLFVGCYNLKFLFQPTTGINVKKYLSMMLPWNLFILLFVDTRYSAGNLTMEYRYYLIAFIPLMILFAIRIGEWLEKGAPVLRTWIGLGLAGGVFILWAGSCKTVWEYRGISQYVNDIHAYINTLDQEVESVFFLPDEQTPEMLRLIDDTRTYCAYSSGGGLVVYDYYEYFIDRSSHGDQNLLFVYDWETPDMYLPYHISSQYEKIGSVRWFDVYYAPVNLFDSVSGFPTADRSTDFFYSPGYVINGNNSAIDDNGLLSVNGNGEEAVNSGILPPFEGLCDLTLFYETDLSADADSIGVLELRDGDEVILSQVIPSGSGSVTIEPLEDALESPSIHITIDSGVSCRLSRIEFTRK